MDSCSTDHKHTLSKNSHTRSAVINPVEPPLCGAVAQRSALIQPVISHQSCESWRTQEALLFLSSHTGASLMAQDLQDHTHVQCAPVMTVQGTPSWCRLQWFSVPLRRFYFRNQLYWLSMCTHTRNWFCFLMYLHRTDRAKNKDNSWTEELNIYLSIYHYISPSSQ